MTQPKSQLLLDILDEMWISDYWIDPLAPLLEGWSVKHATKPFHKNVASVLAMVNHTAFWEDFALHLLKGESIEELGILDDSTHGNYPNWMPAWPEAADNYRRIRGEIRSTLAEISAAKLSIMPPEDSIPLEARIYTRSIHASYHAGQVNLLRRLYGMPDATVSTSLTDSFARVDGARDLLLGMMDSAWTSGFSINPFEDLTKDLSVGDANESFEDLPSIKEIVNHMKYWEEYVTRRLRGEDTDDMPRVGPGSSLEGMPGWPEARECLISQHAELRAATAVLSDEELAQTRPGMMKPLEEGKSAQWLIYGVVEHHAYHVGQIVILRQLMGHEEYLIR